MNIRYVDECDTTKPIEQLLPGDHFIDSEGYLWMTLDTESFSESWIDTNGVMVLCLTDFSVESFAYGVMVNPVEADLIVKNATQFRGGKVF